MHARRPFRHKRRRNHYHPAALGWDTGSGDGPAVSRRGLLATAIVLVGLSAPFGLAFAMALTLGQANTQRWLSSVNAEWLALWLR